MFVGHAPSLEGCSRQLIGEPIRSFEEFLFINRQITFLSMAQCERNMLTGKWELTPIRVNNCDELALQPVTASSSPNDFQLPVMSTNQPAGYLTYECSSNHQQQQQQQRPIYQDPYSNCFYAG